jgi:hypothetical protein
MMGVDVSFLLITLWVSMILPAMAHLEPTVNSYWATTTPNINGVLAPGEWADAAVRDFTLQMRSRGDGSLDRTLNGRMYVKNNYTSLFITVQIFNDYYLGQDFANNYTGLAVFFDNNHDGVLQVGENGEGVTTWVHSAFYSKNDLYYFGGGFWDADVNAGKTNDGSLGWNHTAYPTQGAIGNYTFEMMIPLVGTDGPNYDFAITSLPKTVGFKIWLQEPARGLDGVYPDDPSIPVNIQEIANAATFGNLIIHPLYTLTIVTTAGGTTDPAPGAYQYGFGTVVSVQANPGLGYQFDHWELDTVNVGSANPYSVTMDQNHTLKAFFVPKPQAPVGGTSFSFAEKTPMRSLVGYSAIFGIFTVAAVLVTRKRR